MKQTREKYDPNEELQHAIEDLHVFVEQNCDSSIPSVYQLDVKDGHLVVEKFSNPLAKVIDLTRCFFGAAFSNHARNDQLQKKNNVNQTLLKAVGTVSSHYPLIEKLKKGSLDERRFADDAIDIIHRYNELISKKIVVSQSSWTSRFAEYIYYYNQLTLDEELKKAVIILPQSASYDSDSLLSSKKVRHEATPKSTVLYQKFSTIQPSQHEVDAFRMKGITLIQKHQIPNSIHEVLSSLKEAPIVVESNVSDQQDCSLPAIFSLHQTLKPFPGEVIKFTGSFKQTPHALLRTPIPESFRVSSQSTQTAFPHPLLHTGCSFSDVLIPNYPLRPDQLPLFNLLAEKKREIAYSLLPKGHYRSKAKQLIESKKIAFEKNKNEFLELHITLAKAILEASDLSSEENIQIIDVFFSYVKKEAQPYDFLAGIYQIIENECLSSLYNRLQDEWLEVGNVNLRGSDDQSKYNCALSLMQAELASRLNDVKGMGLANEVSSFIYCLGIVLGQATQSIVLQSMSEKIGFPPPMLSDFEQKVQSCSINQVMKFLAEIQESQLEDTSSRMKTALEEEIALFQIPQFDSLTSQAAEISKELEVYFGTRFYVTRK